MMKINKNIIFIIMVLLMLAGVMTAAAAYTGTGFSHDKSVSDYSSLSLNDILSKYSDTDCKAEATGVCSKVSDGDTITVEGVGKVRLVGVNTPEKGVAGADASAYFVKKLCLNREVSIDIDDSKHTDKYGRTLAVVIVDGKNLNEMLLKEGLAEIMYMPPSEFYPYNWAGNNTHVAGDSSTSTDSSSGDTSSGAAGTYIGNSNSHKFHYPTCKSVGKMSEKNKVTFSSRDEAINQGYTPCKNCNP
ncbi:MAG: thermonuclease family protein [Methanobrevibacter sp.]|uniref:thermonuclease family protein n=1 Tax=Methanobrevibacter millerae TaxID=230361 RepID=UPI0026E988B0|nr:thermonuclease family protein [Methanobrevibacter millerae]MBR0058953.1 thermonuclease family protein [Methanobrevibacter sp.]